MGKIIKFAIIAAIVCFPMYGLFWFMDYATTLNPLPTDSLTTIKEFFIGLQEKKDQDFFRCRELLTVKAKTPLLLKQNTVEYINDNFDRVRNYLIERAGPDFASDVQIKVDSGYLCAFFNHDIVLRCTTDTHWGNDDKTHFSLASIHDFPMYVMPALGVEQRNLELNRMIESLDDAEATEEAFDESDSIEDILAFQPGESPSVRLERLTINFHYSSMLDIRHAVFDAILEEFPNNPATMSFLQRITRENYDVAEHVKDQARKIINPETQAVIK